MDTLALNHPGIRVISEVASFLSAGLGVEDILQEVAGALARGLPLDYCHMWIRTADGSGFRPITAPGEQPPSGAEAQSLARKLAARSFGPVTVDGRVVRAPLFHEGEALGFIEARMLDSADHRASAEILQVVARILSPLLGSIELSEDLASEVAHQTREIVVQRRFTAKIIDSLPVGLYVIDREYRVQAWNRKRETGTQGITRDNAIGRTIFDVLRRQSKDLLQQEFDSVFKTGKIEEVEVESGSINDPRYYRITKIPMRLDNDEVTHVITIGEDLTAAKTVQREVAQTEKLAAVGQLAAGVMHEINNPLATIAACVEALTGRLDDLPFQESAGFEKYLTIIESELSRCKSIVDGLLDFSRPKARFKHVIRLNQVIEDAIFLVRHHENFMQIRLTRDISADLPNIYANREQLIQVFLSLMLNAIDAMEGKGVLGVSAYRSGYRNDEVVVEFTDTGPGVAREHLTKIFEPFYTTKEPGRGTGLGLSICYGIVQQHGGRILVDSPPGSGATFRVFLPVESARGPAA